MIWPLAIPATMPVGWASEWRAAVASQRRRRLRGALPAGWAAARRCALAIALGCIVAWAAPGIARSTPDEPSAAPVTPAVPPAQGEPAPAEPAPEPAGGLAEQAQNVAKHVAENLRGQSITLGGGYSRDKFSIYKLQGIPTEGLGIALVDMTDSGTFTPYVQYDSAELPLASAPLKAGALTLGYNFTATYSTFDVNRELIDNPWGGEDRGTRVHGDFFLAGALVFARLGPLFPGSEVFWHAGLGAGGALMRYTGNVEVRQGQHFGELHDVSGGADNLRPFTTLLWELQFGHWLVSFRTLTIGFGSSDEQAQLTRDSLSLAYNFQF